MPLGGAGGHNLGHLEKCEKVSEVAYISVTTDQKSFIFGPIVPSRVGIHTIFPDSRVPASGWGWRSKFRTSLRIAIFSDLLRYLTNHLLESIYT